MNTEDIKETFTKYVEENFDISVKNIRRKLAHSLRVQEICVNIANAENFDEEDKKISGIAGLLHDYARFYQWTKFNTFSDLKSTDHGDLAIEFLFNDNEIDDYSTSIRDYDEIYDAIRYHNKFSIPDYLSEHNTRILKVARDADKLDIFYQYSINDTPYIEDNSPLSYNVLEMFNRKEQVRYSKEDSNNDSIILTLSMIYDINYDYTLKVLAEENYLDKMLAHLKDKEKYKEYFDKIKIYIKERLGE